MPPLGRTGLDVFPLCLGGSVFGWIADEPQSVAVLDTYVGVGGNFIDTPEEVKWLSGHREVIEKSIVSKGRSR